MYVNRTYRILSGDRDLRSFRVVVGETDLHISVDLSSYKPELENYIQKLILALRHDLEQYISLDSEFRTTLKPHVLLPGAPPIAVSMALAANAVGVGPMAAVAGTFAEYIGKKLLEQCAEVIVENGGDIYMSSDKSRLVSVFAGQSPFSQRLAIEVLPEHMPVGICTSSGTVGPSLSFGKADAAVVMAESAALADAAASVVGNAVQTVGDVKKGIAAGKKIKNISGVLVIKDDQLAVWGSFRIVPIRNNNS